MPLDSDRDAALTQRALVAAHLYYLQDRTMGAIADELRTSRSTVSRLLSHARATGLVDIRIRSPLDEPRELERQLSAELGLSAHVAPMPDEVSEIDRLERVAVTAARLLDQFVDSNATIGVAWGATLAALSRHLIPHATHGVRVVQLNGSGNTRSTGLLYASEILRRFGEAYGAQVQQFPVPAFFDDPLTRSAMWRERSTRRILDIQARMDIVLFSTGAAHAEVPSHVYTGGYLEESDLASLERQEVVGDVATVFFRADGSTDGITLNSRSTGPDFAVLRAVPRRVCIVAGEAKVPSLRGAIAAGLVTDLVIDEQAARALNARR